MKRMWARATVLASFLLIACEREPQDCTFFWTPPEPSAPGRIQFLSDDFGFVRDYRTLDGGTTWTHYDPQVDWFEFVSPEVAWATGLSGLIFRSLDSGQRFQQVYARAGSRISLNPLNESQAFALILRIQSYSPLSIDYYLIRTLDGGSTWTDLNLPNPGSFRPQAMHFISQTTGFLSGENSGTYEVQRTTDGGSTWTLAYSSSSNQVDYFSSSGSTILAGGRGNILRTTDSGVTWTEADSLDLSMLLMRSTDVVFAMLRHPGPTHIMQSMDGGSNWIEFKRDGLSMDLSTTGKLYYSTTNHPGLLFGSDGSEETEQMVPTTEPSDSLVGVPYSDRSGCMM